MEKADEHVFYNELFDLYGNLLNERERNIFSLFYVEDLSLQEIADLRGVSKSSIGNAIKIINQKLNKYEGLLKCLNKKKLIKKALMEENVNILRQKVEKILDINV